MTHPTPARDRAAHRDPWSLSRTIGGLSPQELLVVHVAAVGAQNKEIAQRLGLAEGTVKNHVTSILRKLGVGNKIEALHALGWRLPETTAADALADRLLVFAAYAADLRRELDALDVAIDALGEPPP